MWINADTETVLCLCPYLLHWNHLFPRQYTRIPWNQKVFHVWLIIKLFKFILHHSSQHQLHWQSCNMNSPTRSNVFFNMNPYWRRNCVVYKQFFMCVFILFCCYEEDSELFKQNCEYCTSSNCLLQSFVLLFY